MAEGNFDYDVLTYDVIERVYRTATICRRIVIGMPIRCAIPITTTILLPAL